MVHGKSPVKGKYLLAIVEEVNQSKNGFVRLCVVRYRNPDPKAMGRTDSVWKVVMIRGSVKRLTLLLSVGEQTERLEIRNFKFDD